MKEVKKSAIPTGQELIVRRLFVKMDVIWSMELARNRKHVIAGADGKDRCAMIVWCIQDANTDTVISRGSAFAIEIGEGFFVIKVSFII